MDATDVKLLSLTELMRLRGFTDERLGALVDVGPQTVSAWRRGLSRPQRKLYNRLLSVLEISGAELDLKPHIWSDSDRELIRQVQYRRWAKEKGREVGSEASAAD